VDLSQLTSLLKDNHLVAGGIAVTITGVVFTYLKELPRKLFEMSRRWVTLYFMSSVEVDEDSIMFGWVRIWLHGHFKVKRNFLGFANYLHTDENGRPKVMILPGSGSHLGIYRRTVMWVSYRRAESKSNDPGAKYLKGDIYTLTFLTWNASIVTEFLKECRDFANPKDSKIDIRMGSAVHFDGGWPTLDRIQPRSLSSVIVADDGHYKILEDIKKFISERNKYRELGIPYRRGYLLHGKPGCGKTSVITAIAGELRRNLYVLPLATDGMDDNKLFKLLSCTSDDAIVLIEDIDCAFAERERSEDNISKITFSGLLNSLDGVFAKEGRILFMTTNHIEKLDDALIRPGRIDYRLELKNATNAQARLMWGRFFPGEPPAPEIVALKDYEYSMAKVQEMLVHRMSTGEMLPEIANKHQSPCISAVSGVVANICADYVDSVNL